MSNALGIGPAVMINRLVLQAGASPQTMLAKVAEMRFDLQAAADKQQAQDALTSPTGEADPVVIDSGAVVDKLI